MNIKTANILIAEGYSNVFVIDPPDDIKDYILISKSGGFGLDTTDAGFGRPTIQILVANKTYSTLDTTIKNIINTLINVKENANGILGYDMLSDAIELGRDKQTRYMNSINFKVFYNLD